MLCVLGYIIIGELEFISPCKSIKRKRISTIFLLSGLVIYLLFMVLVHLYLKNHICIWDDPKAYFTW